MKYTKHFKRLDTPQTEQADPRQEKNSAGGYAFVLDNWKQLERFLILGSEGGTYYVGERQLTRDNAKCVERCLAENGGRTVDMIISVSQSYRAPKNSPAIFALALAASCDQFETRQLALFAALPLVCRTGTHLYEFVTAVKELRGWGRSLRVSVSRWFVEKPEQKLLYQLCKYRQRQGMSSKDVFRLAHPRFLSAKQAPARWVVGATTHDRTVVRQGKEKKYPSVGLFPEYLQAFNELQQTDSLKRVLQLVTDYGFTHEMLPSEWLKKVPVWEALLPKMLPTALIRNLGRLTALGLLEPMTPEAAQVASRLDSESELRSARVHPMAMLLALTTYQAGQGVKGALTWMPNQQIVDALDSGFYKSFGNVAPTGSRTMLALDISGSMGMSKIANTHITPRVASAAMAMVTARVEKNWVCMGFSHHLTPLDISPRRRLDDVVKTISGLSFGATDCALPMLHALEQKLEIDTFIAYTDNETFRGLHHPHEALMQYRRRTGIAAKLIVVGMTATQFTIANPTDPGMLDVVGFDADAPGVIADFSRSVLTS